jgi:protein TonB
MKTLRSLLCLASLAALAAAAPAYAESIENVPNVATKSDTPPRPLKTKAPRYPEQLRADGVSGAVLVALVIDEGGKVIASEVTKASNDGFRSPALEAVRTWTFEPAKVAGKPVRAKVSIPLNFSAEA